MTCCVGTCTNRAVILIRFWPHGVRSFAYCRYHGLSRDGTAFRWPGWKIVASQEIP